MRKIVDIGGHSLCTKGLRLGQVVLDVGANRGRFTKEVSRRLGLYAVAVEANPELVKVLRHEGITVIEGALAASTAMRDFHIGANEETSSMLKPTTSRAHLQVTKSVVVQTKTLPSILAEASLVKACLIKLDIEGAEIEVLTTLDASLRAVSPQWTVEFHDEREFGLSSRDDVDRAIAEMRAAGFSVLVRNWPARTNVLFVNRSELGIGFFEWLWMKLRYQWLSFLWRAIIGI